MTAQSTLRTLQKLINMLPKLNDHECVVTCMTIDHILNALESWAEESEDAKYNHPNPAAANIYITEMQGPLYSIAGLNDDGHDKEQCILWLNGGIQKLASLHCFDVRLYE
ncbi:MAG: hypothetical protein CVU71_00975 [Deltaproteobacteria bacterium HGW-Deltaproteobacteria-6]|nr:MAG: hypothetical protein CVU71_00975 [Deltaproteobacteria bacterium HGW-Deltaproteobacteria-6]